MRYFAIALLAACGSNAATPSTTPDKPAPTARDVAYFEGTTTTTSPDGATPYGPPVPVIVRRTTDAATKTIEEYVVNPGEEHPATMTQRDGAVFAVVDPKGEFDGTLTFAGPAWHYTSWTYAIKLGDKGTLTGHGEVSATTLSADKQFVDPTGTPRARIRDDMHAIDEATFQRRLAEMLPAAK